MQIDMMKFIKIVIEIQLLKEFVFSNVKEPRFGRNLLENYHFYKALYTIFIEKLTPAEPFYKDFDLKCRAIIL